MLDERTLVLNRHWVPIGTTSVRTALCLLYRETARAVSPGRLQRPRLRLLGQPAGGGGGAVHTHGQPPAQGPGGRSPHRATIAYPRHRVTFSRRNIYRRDRYTCQYCGARPRVDELSVDHVVPRSRGGPLDLDQLRALLPPLQPPQGKSPGGGGRHCAAPPSGRAAAGPPASAFRSGTRQDLVAAVHLPRVLERGAGELVYVRSATTGTAPGIAV